MGLSNLQVGRRSGGLFQHGLGRRASGARSRRYSSVAPASLFQGSPKVDLDFENSRFWINGKAFSSLVDMVLEGTLLYNVNGSMVFKLDTPLSGPTYHRLDHTTTSIANASALEAKAYYELFDSATGGNLGGSTPSNYMAMNRFWDGANHVLAWGGVAAGVNHATGTTWTKVRSNQSRGYITTRNDLNLHSHTVNDTALQTDTSFAILTGLDRLIVGNRREMDRPSNTGVNGEVIHRFTVWEGTASDAVVQALSTRQSGNLMSYSDDLSNAVWTRTTTNITANAIAGPSGEVTADLMTEISGAAIVGHSTVRAVPGWAYTCYFDLKASGTTWVRVIFGNSTTNGWEMWVNLATGAKGTVQPRTGGWDLLSSSVTALGNGWYRCRLTIVPTGLNLISANVMTATADASVTRQNSTYYVGGLQITQGTAEETYMPRAA